MNPGLDSNFPVHLRKMNTKDLVQQAYDDILKLITERIWSGSESLSDIGLAHQLGMSRTPVRLALARLESEGLVRQAPGKGWVPCQLTVHDLEHIFDMKEALEALVARQAAAGITAETQRALAQALAEMQTAVTGDNLQQWCAADDAFHEILYGIVGNDRLHECVRRLNNQWLRYRMGYLAQENHLPTLYHQHQLIAEAIIAGESNLAAEYTVQHLRHVRTSIIQIMKQVLIPFLGTAQTTAIVESTG